MPTGYKRVVNPGDRFNQWSIVKEVLNDRPGRYFLCQCDCKRQKIIILNSLTRGLSTGCGCKRGKHREYKTRLHCIWTGLKQRCLNPKNKRYKYYGGKGITVCDEWLEFEPFRTWALTNGYEEHLTIERNNNDGNYEPKNCSWIPRKDQNSNKQYHRLVIYKNQRRKLLELAKEFKIPRRVLASRLKYGWTIERALNQPIRGRHRRFLTGHNIILQRRMERER